MNKYKILTSQKFKIFTYIDFKELYNEEKLMRQDHSWIRYLLTEILDTNISDIYQDSEVRIDIDTSYIPFSKYEITVTSNNIGDISNIKKYLNKTLSEITDFILYIKQNFNTPRQLDFVSIYNSFIEKKEILKLELSTEEEINNKRI